MMLRKKKLTQNAGSCTTWLIRQFLFGIDPFYYQCVTVHIKWKCSQQARKVSDHINVLGGYRFFYIIEF
jgi:murein endopeptidase